MNGVGRLLAPAPGGSGSTGAPSPCCCSSRAHLLWRRGTETRLKPRLKRAPARLRGPAGPGRRWPLSLVFAGTGAWIYYNTNVLNEYRTRDDADALRRRI